MKQVFRTQLGIKVVDVPVPMIGDNDILVKVFRSMISTGTETMSMKKDKISLIGKVKQFNDRLNKLNTIIRANGIEKTYRLAKLKLDPSPNSVTLSATGYSVSGVVVSVGKNLLHFHTGDRVACAGSGIAAHSEYVVIPKNLAVKIPDNISFDQAALTTIGSIALQGLRRANVTFGDTIVVTGLGLIGLLAIQIAKAWGLNVIAIDINADRVDLAHKLGADYTFNANEPELDTLVKNITEGQGVDAVVICAATKSDSPVNQAMRLCRRKGTVTIVGAVGMNIERDQMYIKEIDLAMSTSYGPGRYDDAYEFKGVDYPIGYVKWTENRNMQEFIRLMALGKIETKQLIDKIYPFTEAPQAFKYLLDPVIKPIGALLSYNEDVTFHEPSAYQVENLNYIFTKSPTIQVGIIGAGGFIQGNHLPNLKELDSIYSIKAICDKNPAVATGLTRKYGAAYSTTDYHTIINDSSIDFVIIGTRHNLHAQLAIECLKADKHVLIEKPVAMTLEELDELDITFKQSKRCLTAGFNRRYSPFARSINDVFTNRVSPMMIVYRINAGSYPLSNWIHSPSEGGGRIIGEACHFLDFVNFVVGKPISDYGFYHIPTDDKIIQADDNLSLCINYTDGSIANMIYTSIGNKKMDKERVEIFCDNKSLVLDNFINMEFYGVNGKDIHLKKMDKGFKQELIDFSKIMKGDKSISLSWDSIYSTTKITIEIMNKITK